MAKKGFQIPNSPLRLIPKDGRVWLIEGPHGLRVRLFSHMGDSLEQVQTDLVLSGRYGSEVVVVMDGLEELLQSLEDFAPDQMPEMIQEQLRAIREAPKARRK